MRIPSWSAELEKAGKLTAVITQNIDGLHQAAGSKNVYELHGSTLRNNCMKCGEFYDIDFIAASSESPDKIPHYKKCGGTVKPDVVLYEEALDNNTMAGAIAALQKASFCRGFYFLHNFFILFAVEDVIRCFGRLNSQSVNKPFNSVFFFHYFRNIAITTRLSAGATVQNYH